MRRMWLALAVCCSFAWAQAEAPPALAAADRVRIREVYRLARALDDRLWPHWSRTPFALLLVSGDSQFLIHHPKPPADYRSLGRDRVLETEVYWHARTYPANFLATFPISDPSLPTIVVGEPEATHKNSTQWVVTILHEHFHQLQYSQPSYYKDVDALGLSHGDKTGMWMLNYPFPYKDPQVNARYEKVRQPLLSALTKPIAYPKFVSEFVSGWQEFLQNLTAEDQKYLLFQVWQEGVARYTEIQVADFAAQHFRPSASFQKLADFVPFSQIAAEARNQTLEELAKLSPAQDGRLVFYPLGASIALLLDREKPDWKSEYLQHEFTLPVEEVLPRKMREAALSSH